jgi:hypothetical protein
MEALITQFETLKMQFLAFEETLRVLAPEQQQSRPAILLTATEAVPKPSTVITQTAKEVARAALQERIEKRVKNIRIPEPKHTRWEYVSTAQHELDEIEQQIAYKEAERAIRRMRPTKLQLAAAQVRLDNPDFNDRAVYREARRLLALPPPPTKFQAACAEVRKAHPTMPDPEVYVAARMRLKVKACAPGLAALNNN